MFKVLLQMLWDLILDQPSEESKAGISVPILKAKKQIQRGQVTCPRSVNKWDCSKTHRACL